MTFASLLYVSESRIDPANAPMELKRMVEAAQAFNLIAGITGALLFTGTHFAQALEGDEGAIDQVMASINRDPRHTHVRVVARNRIETRRFSDWSLAYQGPSQFVSRHVTRLLNEPTRQECADAAAWLSDLLAEFSRFPR